MMLHYTKIHKNMILLVLCILLILAPMAGTAESDGLIPGENTRHTWLENGNQVIFTPDDHLLSVMGKDGALIVSCNLGQDVEDIACVYADADCLRLLVSAQNGRMIYDIQGNDLKKYTLPEEQICGPVYLTKNGAYYRTADSTLGYFDLASKQSVILSPRQIGGLYSVTSGNETDYLAVSVLPSGEKHILAVQDGSIAWACAMLGTDKDTLIDSMAAVNGDKLLVAYEDMAATSDYRLICYADGKTVWQDELDFHVDRIFMDDSDHIRLIGAYQNEICHAIYDLAGVRLAEKSIKQKCPFNVFLWMNEEFYIVNSAGSDLVSIGNLL